MREFDATEMTEKLFLVTLENVVNRLVMAHQHTAPKLWEAAIKCLVHSKDHICFYSLQLLQQIISHLNFHLKIFL